MQGTAHHCLKGSRFDAVSEKEMVSVVAHHSKMSF